MRRRRRPRACEDDEEYGWAVEREEDLPELLVHDDDFNPVIEYLYGPDGETILLEVRERPEVPFGFAPPQR